jgi:hypothetical protein
VLPPVPEVKRVTPGECLYKTFALYPHQLAALPAGFALMTEDAQAHAQLKVKAQDAALYAMLLGNALRCAPTE